ncbi:MAG: T9SS type A sorting domain-containing protein, partial [Bacteroidota bacterium]
NHGQFENGDMFPRLQLFRNTGVDTLPRYELITDDVANLYADQTYNPGLYPTMGDLDGDGDEDILIGKPNGELDFYNNISFTPNAVLPDFDLVSFGYQGIDVGSHATPQLVDVDRDGLLDLVIGEKDGNLNYYHNDGTANQANFTLVDEEWGGINVSRAFFQPGYSFPSFYWEADTAHVIIGSEQGVMYHFATTSNDLTGDFALLDSAGVGYNLGKRTAPSTADIDADGDMDLVIGNYSGGLSLFRQTGKKAENSVSIRPALTDIGLHVYPNPVRNKLVLESATSQRLFVHLSNIQGQKMWEGELSSGKTDLDLSAWSPGVYILQVQGKGFQVLSEKIVISP